MLKGQICQCPEKTFSSLTVNCQRAMPHVCAQDRTITGTSTITGQDLVIFLLTQSIEHLRRFYHAADARH